MIKSNYMSELKTKSQSINNVLFRNLSIWYIEQTLHRHVGINNIAFVRLNTMPFISLVEKILKMAQLSFFTYKLKKRDYTPEAYNFNTYPHEK